VNVATSQSIQTTPAGIIVNQSPQMQDQQIKLIQTNSQSVQGTQLVNAKIVGVQNLAGAKVKTATTGIRYDDTTITSTLFLVLKIILPLFSEW
jgi:hypothetical protein